MDRVAVAVDEADHDGLDALLAKLLRGLRDLVLVERRQDLAAGPDPLGDDLAVAAPDERAILPGHLLVDRVVLGPLVPRDVEDVAVAAGRDEPDRGAVVLEERVRRDRRAVEERVDCGRVAVGGAHSLDQTLGGVGGGRGHLVDPDLGGLRVRDDDVGERPADVDAGELHLGVLPV